MTSQEIYEAMEAHWLTFKENHDRFQEKQVKAAGVRARKSINEMKKLVIMETDKKPKEVADTLKLKNVDAKDNFDDPSRVLLGPPSHKLYVSR
jgi:hypothetical protein